MPTLSSAAIAFLASTCGHGADPRLIDVLAQQESGRNPMVISAPNRNGTYDAGLMQINSANFDRFKLTHETAIDPCRSVDAAVQHLVASGGPDVVKKEAVDALLRATQACRAIQAYNPGDPKYCAKIVARLQNEVTPTSVTEPAQAKSPSLRQLASQFPSFKRSQ